MTRSVHTDPLDIRAARRLAAPDTARGIGARRLRHRTARRAKRKGEAHYESRRASVRPASRVRIIESAPGDGYSHPAGRAEVRRFLDQLPPRYRYKLHAIELRSLPVGPRHARPLGRLLLPGRVILYAQSSSPWLLHGMPAKDEQARLRQAGAQVSVDRRSCLTVVTWPAHSLRDFMLEDVLLHELAHHLLQVSRAKPTVHIARVGDHEACAAALARGRATRFTRHARECA